MQCVPRSRSNGSTKKNTEALFFNVMFHNQRVSNFMSANKVPRDSKLMYIQWHYTYTRKHVSVHVNNTIVEYLGYFNAL